VEERRELVVDPVARLLVFGFDQDMKDGRNFEPLAIGGGLLVGERQPPSASDKFSAAVRSASRPVRAIR
jgi:hypothetical protein